MTEQTTMPDWVLIEAAKRGNLDYYNLNFIRNNYGNMSAAFRALCDLILKHEQPPVDRKVLCAREACREWTERADWGHEAMCIRAIELWEQWFGQ